MVASYKAFPTKPLRILKKHKLVKSVLLKWYLTVDNFLIFLMVLYIILNIFLNENEPKMTTLLIS